MEETQPLVTASKLYGLHPNRSRVVTGKQTNSCGCTNRKGQVAGDSTHMRTHTHTHTLTDMIILFAGVILSSKDIIRNGPHMDH